MHAFGCFGVTGVGGPGYLWPKSARFVQLPKGEIGAQSQGDRSLNDAAEPTQNYRTNRKRFNSKCPILKLTRSYINRSLIRQARAPAVAAQSSFGCISFYKIGNLDSSRWKGRFVICVAEALLSRLGFFLVAVANSTHVDMSDQTRESVRRWRRNFGPYLNDSRTCIWICFRLSSFLTSRCIPTLDPNIVIFQVQVRSNPPCTKLLYPSCRQDGHSTLILQQSLERENKPVRHGDRDPLWYYGCLVAGSDEIRSSCKSGSRLTKRKMTGTDLVVALCCLSICNQYLDPYTFCRAVSLAFLYRIIEFVELAIKPSLGISHVPKDNEDDSPLGSDSLGMLQRIANVTESRVFPLVREWFNFSYFGLGPTF
ncbi:hypothetical protein C8J56DRAFT_881959 [Mycena floridula]|nr:hypothetical protein C8J56DRAFT_881959 [Mycena floridula]